MPPSINVRYRLLSVAVLSIALIAVTYAAHRMQQTSMPAVESREPFAAKEDTSQLGATAAARHDANTVRAQYKVSDTLRCRRAAIRDLASARNAASCEDREQLYREAPLPAWTSTAERGPADGATYYFSDCQVGASAGCVPGNNANAGTSEAAPKQTLTGINVNTLPAGSRLLFNRGGAWNWTSIVRLDNRNTDAESPLTFAAYGTGAAPLLNVASTFAFETGDWQNTVPDGGYVFRGLKFDGGLRGGGNKAIWLRGTVSDVLIENVEITGFYIALYGQGHDDIQRVTVRKSRLTRNTGMGVLGTFNNSLFEGNIIDNNNFSGSALDHGMYLSNMTNATLRGNTFLNNSIVSGQCMGGNLTVHGIVDGLIIENNRIYQQTSAPSCFGISITNGHGDVAEVFRNVTIRNNAVVNLGGCAICLNSAPSALVEGNLIINTTANPHDAIHIHGPEAGQIDHAGGGEIVRNNVACFALPERKTLLYLGTAGAMQSGNVARTGAAAFTGACRRRIAVTFGLDGV